MTSKRVAVLVAVGLLAVSVPTQATSPPDDRIEETHKGHQAGVVYSVHGSGNVRFSDASRVCVNLDYHEPWHDASWSLVMWDGFTFQSATFFLLDPFGDTLEAFVVVDTRGVDGPRREVSVIDIPEFFGGTGTWCLGFDRITTVTFDDEMHVLVGAPDAAWTNVSVDLRAGTQMNWDSALLPQDAGLWATDRDMRHRPNGPGLNVRAGPAQAAVQWGINETVPAGNRTFALAGPMPRSAATGTWGIDGPGGWDVSWTGVGAPSVAVNGRPIGLVGMFNTPSGLYDFHYDGATAGLVGFFAHLLPYDAPPMPSAP